MRTRQVIRGSTELALLLSVPLLACDGGGGATADGGGDAGAADLATPDVFSLEPLPELPAAPMPVLVAGGLVAPCGLAAGGDGLVVAEEGAGRLVTVALDGAAAPRDLAPGLGGASRVAVSGSDVVVTQRGTGKVMRVRAGASTALAEGQAAPGRLRVDGGFAYWIAEGTNGMDGAIRRVSIDGGTVEEIAKDLAGPRGLAVAGGRVYATLSGLRTLAYFPIGGGTPIWFKDKQGNTPVDVIATTGMIFWTAPGDRPGGFIHRMDPDLITDTRVSESPPGAAWLALDDERVYWTSGQTISYAPRGGGTYQDLAIETAACDIALAGGSVYWTEPSTGRIWRAPAP